MLREVQVMTVVTQIRHGCIELKTLGGGRGAYIARGGISIRFKKAYCQNFMSFNKLLK